MAKMLHKNVAQNVTKSCTKLLGTSRSNDVTATRTSLKKVNVRSFSRYRDYSYLLCQMYANPSEFELQGTIFKLRKRNKILSLLVQVLRKTRNKLFSRPSRAKTARKCTEKCEARAKLLFWILNLLFFRRPRCCRVVGSYSPYNLIDASPVTIQKQLRDAFRFQIPSRF